MGARALLMVELGRSEPMPLRSVWLNEAKDFTPWLADNLDVLGQAVGLALELRQREYPVGRYALDLLLQDAQGRVVAVENQLEQTDHSHLGQLEWLNTNTVACRFLVGVGT